MPTTKWVTGTATDDQDLFAKLVTFLTTDTTLAAAGEEWTEVWDHTDGDESGIVLVGPGLSGTDSIHVGLRLNRDVSDDKFSIELRGMTGYTPTGLELEDHVNVSPKPAYVFVDSGSMTYWFIASGRHFIVIVKVTTVFEAGYAGWFLPFGTPGEYPYPMFIGGSGSTVYTSLNCPDSPSSWRDAVAGHTQFPFPSADTTSPSFYDTPAYLLDPGGSWKSLSNTGSALDGTVGPVYTRGSRQFSTGDTADLCNPAEAYSNLTDCYGGDRMIFPLTLHETDPGSQTYGVLDGCFKCQGDGMGAEDTITIGGVDHLVVQNCFRTGLSDYWCVELS